MSRLGVREATIAAPGMACVNSAGGRCPVGYADRAGSHSSGSRRQWTKGFAIGWDLAAYCPAATGQGHGSGLYRTGQPSVSRSPLPESTHGHPLVGPTPCFGKWNSQLCPFRRWTTSGVCERLFQALSGTPIWSTPARGRHCPGPPEGRWRKRGTQHQAIDQSRSGLTTKSGALVDAMGSLMRFLLLPGQIHHSKGVMPLIKAVPFGALLADKVFKALDNDWLLTELDARGATAGIPPRPAVTTGGTTRKPANGAT